VIGGGKRGVKEKSYQFVFSREGGGAGRGNGRLNVGRWPVVWSVGGRSGRKREPEAESKPQWQKKKDVTLFQFGEGEDWKKTRGVGQKKKKKNKSKKKGKNRPVG